MRARISSSLARAVAMEATRGEGSKRASAAVLLPLRAPPIRNVSIVEESAPQMVELARGRIDGRLGGGSKREEKTLDGSFSFAFHLSPKRGAFLLRGRFPDLQVVVLHSLPIPYGEQWRRLRM